jgi:hypothetical protein
MAIFYRAVAWPMHKEMLRFRIPSRSVAPGLEIEMAFGCLAVCRSIRWSGRVITDPSAISRRTSGQAAG